MGKNRDRSCRWLLLHEQRRKIEELGEEVYDSVTYYEIRVLALLEMGVERGFLSKSEVEDRINEIKKRGN